eukprot:3330805-Heterocapsa_arctica.AAC.1
MPSCPSPLSGEVLDSFGSASCVASCLSGHSSGMSSLDPFPHHPNSWSGGFQRKSFCKRVPPLMRADPQSLLTSEDKARAKCLTEVPRTLPSPPSTVA